MADSLVGFITFVLTAGLAGAAMAQQPITVTAGDGAVSIRARDALRADVLRELALATGIEVVGGLCCETASRSVLEPGWRLDSSDTVVAVDAPTSRAPTPPKLKL